MFQVVAFWKRKHRSGVKVHDEEPLTTRQLGFISADNKEVISLYWLNVFIQLVAVQQLIEDPGLD